MGLNFILIGEVQHVEYLIKMGGELTELRFDPMIFGSDTMLNHHLS